MKIAVCEDNHVVAAYLEDYLSVKVNEKVSQALMNF